MRITTPLIALIGAAALTLTACTGPGGSGSGTTGTPVDGETFTMAIGADPGTLNPMITSIGIARTIDRFLYTRLLEVQTDGSIISGLASEWEADTTTASFTLRAGASCEDGTDFTASQVTANITFIGDPANESALTGVDVQAGTVAVGDDATGIVTVTSGVPDPFLLESVGSISLVCGSALTDPDALAKGEGATGMYTMTEIAPNSQYTLTLRDEFTWGPGDWDAAQPGSPAKVVFTVVPNETTASNLLIAGDVNAAQIIGPDGERLRGQKLFSAEFETALGQLYFNQNSAHLGKSEALRVALTQGLNLDDLFTVITGGKGKTPTGLITSPPNPCQIDSVTGNVPSFDAKGAAAALDSEGWKVGADGIREKDGEKLTLTLLFPTYVGDSFVASAELLQSMWTELGVEVVAKGADATGMNDAMFSTGDWDASMVPLGLGIPSQLVAFVSGPTPPNGTNFASIDNAGYNAGVAIATTKAGQSGCEDWADAEVSLLTSASVVPFANSVITTFGNGATFEMTDTLVPTSIEMH